MTKRILHYELLDKIGHGGMGEVYLARDGRDFMVMEYERFDLGNVG